MSPLRSAAFSACNIVASFYCLKGGNDPSPPKMEQADHSPDRACVSAAFH